MRTLQCLGAVVGSILLLLPLLSAPARPNAPSETAVKAALMGRYAQMSQAYRTKSIKVLDRLMMPDFVNYFGFDRQTRSAVQQFIAEQFKVTDVVDMDVKIMALKIEKDQAQAAVIIISHRKSASDPKVLEEKTITSDHVWVLQGDVWKWKSARARREKAVEPSSPQDLVL